MGAPVIPALATATLPLTSYTKVVDPAFSDGIAIEYFPLLFIVALSDDVILPPDIKTVPPEASCPSIVTEPETKNGIVGIPAAKIAAGEIKANIAAITASCFNFFVIFSFFL